MRITALNSQLIDRVEQLMRLGGPYVRARTSSDYWLYATLFASTCPVALDGDRVIGAIVAMRSQDEPHEIYVQDVITHPDHRRHGVANALFNWVIDRAATFGCRRLYLTSEPDNEAAARTWERLGFVNVVGDKMVNGVHVVSDFKGPGKHRAVYELPLG